jgi:hypothetical protein
MNFTMNIHRVKNVRLSEPRLYKSNGSRYVTRDLVVETDDGVFELALFSIYANEDDDQPLLEVKV